MDEHFPRSLDDYCKTYQIDFFTLRLPCIFCGFYASIQDLASFYSKRLSIVWRHNRPFVSCMKCVRHSAIVERQKFCQCCVKCTDLDAVVGRSLRDIVIRCISCYGLLDYAEKIDACVSERLVYLVRGHWRTECRECVEK
uniref:Protein E6 n=1 Tax=Human papillomavirus TaxID=10566 RepID=A0A346TIC7_9PAPI|nr:E6 protein [Human papillomavirus]